jgi:predicted DNA repair protein MutK
MAFSSLFSLLDDIASMLDDVATMTKVAAGKTAGVLGDDLALNAQQVSGVAADRELKVVWAVAKGSFRNKLILVPAAIAISLLWPAAVTPLLMAGGLYLCFEGMEKLAHKWMVGSSQAHAEHERIHSAVADPVIDLNAFERDKIAGAIRTDFILSAEIIVIALGTLGSADLPMRILVLSTVALLMTVGVYGLVAGIVKLDDVGLHLSARPGTGHSDRIVRSVGRWMVLGAPWLMRGLSVAGTIAMFLVGGGILVHGVPALHHALGHLGETLHSLPVALSALGALHEPLLNGVVGILAGGVALAVFTMAGWVIRTDR